MRLNLHRRNCVRFSVFSEFAAPKEKDAEIQEFMERTLTRQDEDDDGIIVTALYGSVSRASGIAHRTTAVLSKKSSEDGVDITLMATCELDEGIEPPPRGLRSVSYLIEAAPDLFGPVEVNCDALFEYERARGFTSKIRFPIPLMVAQDAPDGITHIESAQFSRRDADGVQYLIAVGESDDGAGIAHSVDFETATRLGQSEIRDMFDRAANVSRWLVSLG